MTHIDILFPLISTRAQNYCAALLIKQVSS
uniref:Uncharacterized protein n=1 Tax=Anguilla anguilla TaxID=7936 RepID=A0A0E9P9H4_ANGAN